MSSYARCKVCGHRVHIMQRTGRCAISKGGYWNATKDGETYSVCLVPLLGTCCNNRNGLRPYLSFYFHHKQMKRYRYKYRCCYRPQLAATIEWLEVISVSLSHQKRKKRYFLIWSFGYFMYYILYVW